MQCLCPLGGLHFYFMSRMVSSRHFQICTILLCQSKYSGSKAIKGQERLLPMFVVASESDLELDSFKAVSQNKILK